MPAFWLPLFRAAFLVLLCSSCCRGLDNSEGLKPHLNSGVQHRPINKLRSSAEYQWNTVNVSPVFTPRYAHCSVVFNGAVLVIAGVYQLVDSTESGPQYVSLIYADVWQSTNGSTPWTQLTPAAEFGPRYNMGCAVFQSQVFVIAGEQGRFSYLADVWRSSNGWSYTGVNPAAFTNRSSFGTLAFQDNLWVIAGVTIRKFSGFVLLNDVWRSPDGTAWEQVNTTAGFSPRFAFGSAVLWGRMWIVGGEGDGVKFLQEVWSSANGVEWSNVTITASFSPFSYGVVVAFENLLWLLGGLTPEFQCTSLVWTSADGARWVAQTPLPSVLCNLRAVGQTSILTTGGTAGEKNGTSTIYALSVLPSSFPTCGSVSFACPSNYVPKAGDTQCSSSACVLGDCCTGPLPTCGGSSFSCAVVFAPSPASTQCAAQGCTQVQCCDTNLAFQAAYYVSVTLNADCITMTPSVFRIQLFMASGVPVAAIVVSFWQCASLLAYFTVLGSTPALANAGLAAATQALLSGALGPVLALAASPFPFPLPSAPASPTTGGAYPSSSGAAPLPHTLGRGSSSNPALLALLTLLVVPVALCAAFPLLSQRRACPRG